MQIHPIVEQMGVSPEQMPAVTARGRDIVVTAGAGTGKTRTLVARYLSLLAGDDGASLPLRSILAITFTRKAAREMRNRVRDEIRRYLERADLQEGERRRWQDLYSELDAARIGTIHSLCAEILRSHPAQARVDPRFEVLEEGQIAILRGRALDEAMAWAADDATAAALFPLLGEKGLRNTLKTLLGSRLEANAWFAVMPEPLWPHWEATLLQALTDALDSPCIAGVFDELLPLRDDGTLDHAETENDLLAGPLRVLLEVWDEIGGARQRNDWDAIFAAPDRLNEAAKATSNKGKKGVWQEADPRETLKGLRAASKELAKSWGKEAISLGLDRHIAEAMPGLRSVFLHADAAYRRMRGERQALDFDDLEGGALELLQDESVRRYWQGEIGAILVDEFQDTNERQRDLVRLLNGDGGKLFIVGDAKQSIYRFRGAEVAVFRQERARVEADGGEHIRLGTSYRAHRALIEGLNELLRPVLGEVADPSRPWAEPFAPLGHHRLDPQDGLEPPYIELHLALGTKTDGALDRAADALAARIRALVERSGALGYGDVAILCRASNSFAAYEDALERAGIPFLTVAGRGFYHRPEVRDLLNALRALADPTDDLVLAGLLRSPVIGMSDVGLYDLCRAREAAADGRALWEMLGASCTPAPRGLSDDDGRCALRAAELVTSLRDQVGRSTVADVLKAFLDATDYRAALIQAGQPRAARNVSKLLSDAQGSGIVGVGEFLEYVAGLRDSGAREGEARATAEGAVQIMTVHAAKGLEFPIVVVGDITYGGGRRDAHPLIDTELGILLPAKDGQDRRPATYRVGQVRSDDQDDAESDRLLYVAATRAQEMLILSGYVDLKKDGGLTGLGDWLGKLGAGDHLDLAGQTIPAQDGGARAIPLALHAGRIPVSCTLYESGCTWAEGRGEARGEVAPRPYGASPLLAPLAPVAGGADDGKPEGDGDLPSRVWRVVPAADRPGAPAWVIGSLVHEALAAWRFPRAFDADFVRWAESRARGYGISDRQQLAHAARRSMRLLCRFRRHPLYGEMDGASARLHEVPYSLLVDGQVESGVIDALYRRDGGWTIVEFKTARIADATALDELLGEGDYLVQSARYADAVQALLGQPPRVVLCLLDCEGEVHLHHVRPAP